jgi:hypothetical protein
MNSLLAKLHQPYPFDPQLRPSLATAGLVSGGVFVLLGFLQPFGLDELSTAGAWRAAAIYAAVCFGTMLANALVVGRWLWQKYEDGWRAYHGIGWILYNILSTGLANWAAGVALGHYGASSSGLAAMMLATFSVALLPVSLVVLVKQNRLLHQHLRAAGALREGLAHYHQAHEPPAQVPETGPTVTLRADDRPEGLTIALADFGFAKADDNYVEIHFLAGGLWRREVLRTTLKNVETALAPWPEVFRCHRSYLVNLRHVASIEGNSQGYRLGLGGHQVPVARNLAKALKERMEGG